MHTPRLILLNGFVGAGKSTIAKKFINDNPLALLIEGDELIVNIGDWLANEPEARNMVYELTKAMVRTHLATGHDVVLPYLVTEQAHVQAFEKLATECTASFYNFLLHNDKETAIANLFRRGTWGEAGQEPLSEKDLPIAHELYTRMEQALEHQSNSILIMQSGRDEQSTYDEIKKHLVG